MLKYSFGKQRKVNYLHKNKQKEYIINEKYSFSIKNYINWWIFFTEDGYIISRPSWVKIVLLKNF